MMGSFLLNPLLAETFLFVLLIPLMGIGIRLIFGTILSMFDCLLLALADSTRLIPKHWIVAGMTLSHGILSRYLSLNSDGLSRKMIEDESRPVASP